MKWPAAVVLALALSCTEAPAEPDEVKVTGLDFAYRVDNAVRSGLTKITFANEGADFHMMALRRLADGKTFRDLDLALLNDDEGDDESAFAPGTVDGAPNVVTPGASTTTYADLRAGTYALVCYFPAADGVPHFKKGMLASLAVTPERSGAAPPEVDGVITTTDTALRLPPLSSGEGTFRYVNEGESAHGLTFVRLHDGKGFSDFVAWLDAYFQGLTTLDTRPADVWGGLEAVRGEAYLTLDLPPGDYWAIDTESTDGTAGREFFRDENGRLLGQFTVT